MAKFSLATSTETVPPAELIGKDEMNLAEFPITLLTDRVPEGQKTLHYEDRHGRLTVTGSDDYGLPTAADADVIVALIQLTKAKNNFSHDADPVVYFTRYELIKILNWQDIGKSYRRLYESLHRWAGVTLRYQGSWWNNEKKQKVSVTMHILETVLIYERTDDTAQASLPLSSFTWNKTFLRSCQAGNLKSLNLTTYFSLKHPSSKRLYRFLDKRFNGKPNKIEHVFPLAELAITRVGLSVSYLKNVAKLKEKLQPAIDELEKIGFLISLPRDKRFRKENGGWIVYFTRDASRPAPPAVEEASNELAAAPSPLAARLIERGVTPKTAEALVADYLPEIIEQKLEYFDWEMTQPNPPKKPAGYLVKSIRDGYSPDPAFVSKAVQQSRQETAQVKERDDADARRQQREQDAQEQRQRQQINAYLNRLNAAARLALEATALAAATPASQQAYESEDMAMFRSSLMLGFIREYLAAKPELIESVEA